jgi:hypothetical protein
MSQYDDQLPEDVRDIAARLSAARATPSPLELDELRRRVHGRAARPGNAPQRRGFARVMRRNFVAALLTAGLVMTTGVGVVLASGANNGSISTSQNESASNCQYHKPWSKSYSEWPKNGGTLTVNLVWDGTKLTGSIKYTGTGGFTYQFAGSGSHTVTGSSTSFTAPSGTPSLSVTAGTSTYVFPITY